MNEAEYNARVSALRDEAPARLRYALRERLRQQGLSLAEISHRLAWRPDRTSRLLSGTHQLSVENLYAILNAAGIEAGDFLAELHGFAVVAAGGTARRIRLAIPQELLAQAVAEQLRQLVLEGLQEAAMEAVSGVRGKDLER